MIITIWGVIWSMGWPREGKALAAHSTLNRLELSAETSKLFTYRRPLSETDKFWDDSQLLFSFPAGKHVDINRRPAAERSSLRAVSWGHRRRRLCSAAGPDEPWASMAKSSCICATMRTALWSWGLSSKSFGRRNEASSRALQLRIELPEAAFDSVEEMKPLRGLCRLYCKLLIFKERFGLFARGLSGLFIPLVSASCNFY